MRRLELLRDDLRLRLGAAPRGVVALEREEDDEPEQHGKPRREHSEDAGGSVAVLEVAPARRTSADEQHRHHGHDGDARDEEARPDEAHELLTGNPGAPRQVAFDPTTGAS